MIFRGIKGNAFGGFFSPLFRGKEDVGVGGGRRRGEIRLTKSGGLMHLLWGETVSN